MGLQHLLVKVYNNPTYYLEKDYKYESISQELQLPKLKSDEEAILNLVIEYFGKYSGKVLEEFTHKELPWLKAREGLSQDEPSTRIIDNDLIFEYYTSIKNKYNIVSLADIQSYIDKLW